MFGDTRKLVFLKKKILLGAMIIFHCLFFTSRFSFAFPDDNQIVDLFKNQSDAIVLVAVKSKGGGKLGTGFVVSTDGLIVTNAHVVKGAKTIYIKLKNNRVYSNARVIKADRKKDIVLLKIKAQGLKTVRLGNSNQITIGQRVVSIGNPLGLENTIADGLISGTREVGGLKMFQISVPLSQGSSGGPLFNLKGEVIGVTTASLSGGQNLNFALPINEVKAFVQKMPHHSSQLKTSDRLSSVQTSSVNQHNLYTVLPRDTLYSLAKKFDCPIDLIKQLNNLSTESIHAGQKLKIPK